MTYEELMLFVVKQQKLTRNVVNCYEAGAFGFHLHCRFEELGIKNYVERPQDWDERGNKKAFSMVRIPTVDEERERAISRGFVESVHGTSGSGEIRVGVPARSGVRRKSEHP